MGFKENVSVTLDISANIAQVRSAANELQNILSKSNFSSGFSSKITGMVSQLNDALSQLETKGSKAITGLGDVKGVETSIGKVSTIIRNIAVELDRAGASGSKSLLAMINGMDSKLEQANSAQRQYTKSIQETQSEADKLAKSLDKVQKAQTEAERKSNEALARSNAAKAKIQAAEQTKANLRSSSGRTADSLDSEIEAKMARIKQLQALMSDVAGGGKKLRLFETDKSSFSEDQVKQITEYQNIVSSLTGEVGRLKQEQTALNEEIAKQDEIIKKAKSEQAKADTDQQRSIEDYVKQTAAIQTVQDQIKQLNQTAKDTAAFDEYKQKLSEIFGDETLKNATSIDELNTALERLKESGIKMTADQLQKLLFISSGMGIPLKEMGEKARQAGDGFKQMTDKAQDLDMLTYRLKYFFSMVGGFQLFRRAIRSSIETIKELDAAMTQTAVVSTKTVGQMWKTLPEYTQKAKTLAASIKDVYSAQTLYVQQGLDMDSALGLGVETLKMARVAGIEAAAATDSMTAALRGFKMELNETSAVRINDVYSKLAQNTASNVQEISTAMTKVAALANSANMSFENTAAFLSKIIESTREGAETAGTALKTVIARFTEVKTLYDQGELLGTDEEGQEVDVNKISKALRTAGINMNDFFTGAKGLDEIFIELGKKWDSLTTIQQRYIATQAAGSRQQSRFLALMQDFNRTTELTQMAYNAAGSGQEQFEKTLDSLDAKLTKLKTEWQNFIMGIANSDLVKGFIDFGSKLLETINNVIDKLSGGNGLAKSILSVAAAFGVFKVGGMAVRGILNNVGMALGTRTAGSAGIGAGLVGMKQNFSAFGQVIHPFAGLGKKGQNRIQNKGLESYGKETNGRYNRAAVVSGQAFAIEERAAYDKKSAELTAMSGDEGKEKWIQNAKATGRLSGQATADEENAAYQEALDKKQKEVNTAKKEVDTATTQQQTAQLQAYGAALQGIGMAAGIAAGALFLLANHLEQSKKYSGLAKVAKGLAVGLTVLSVSFMLLGTAAQIAGAMVAAGAKTAETAIKAIPIIGWILAIISAIISLIAIIREFTKQKPPEEVWKEYEESCEKAAEGAKKVQEAYQDAMSQISDISEQEAKLDELIVGTEEWDTAVKNLNQSIMELIKIYPGLADAVKWVNDHWVLDTQSEEYKKWLDENKRTAANANVAEIAMNYGKARQQSIRDIQEFQASDQMKGIKKQSGFLYLGSDWQYQPLLDNHNKLNFQKQGEWDSVYIHDSHYAQPYDENNGNYTPTDNPYNLWIETKSNDTVVSTVGKGWDYLGKLLGDRYVFDSQYLDKNTRQSASTVIQENIKKDYGIENADALYSKIAPHLEQAINDSEVKDLPTLEKFYERMFNSGVLTEGEFKYFTNLIKDNNGNWRQNIPIEEFLRKFNGYQMANAQVMSGAVPLLTAEISDNKNLDKNYSNTYLAYGKSKFGQKYLSYNDEDLMGYENKINPLTGESYAAEAKKAFGVEVQEMGKTLSELGLADAFKEYMRYQLPLEDMYSNKDFKDFNTWFMSFDETTRKTIDNIFGQNIGEIDIKGIQNLSTIYNSDKEKDKNTIRTIEDISGLDVGAILQDYEDIFIGIEDYKNSIESLSTTWEEALNLANQVKQISKNGGKPEQFLEILGKIEKNIPTEKLDKTQRILQGIDWNDTNSIRNGISDLNELGAKIDYALVEEVIAATNAVNKFNLKTLEEQIKSLEKSKGIAEKLENGETTFTAEDYSFLKSLPSFNGEDWVQTGLDEWTYIGEETNSILSHIDVAVGTLLKETIKDTQSDINKGIAIEGVLENNIAANTFNGQAGREEHSIQYYIDKMLEGEEVSDYTRGRIAETFGITSTKPEDILEYYNKYYGVGGASLEGNQEKLAGLQTYEKILPYEYSSAQSVINDQNLTEEQKATTLSTSVKKMDSGEQYLAETDIAKFNKEGKDFSNVVNALTIDSAKAAKRFDNLTQSYKDNADALKKEKKDTREYGLALGNLTKSVKTAYGNNDKITEAFVEKHLDLFKDYANGVEGADEKIRQAMLDEGVVSGTTDQLNQLKATIDSIDSEELTINGTADCSQAFSELAALYGSAEDAAAAMEALGYSVTWEEDGTFTDEHGQTYTNYKAVVKDNAGNVLSRNKSGGGGGGGGGGKEFKNDFDKYYNMVEDINELQRLRNLLETDYKQLLDSEAASGKAIYDNLKEQVDLLKERQKLTADLAEKRKGQIFDLLNDEEYKDVKQYAWWNEEDQTIEIDWDAINKIKDSETGDKVKELVQKLEDFQSKYDEQIEALEDIEDALEDIRKRGRDEYISLEERLRDALIAKIQEQIDELSATNEAINTVNSNLMDSIQKALDQQRQERENAKTEEELANKEQRLAYLQQDSSGANQVEIEKLQKELDEARENYTDQLIDQKISELQEQNDEAAQQRQEQIDLMQQSLDWQEKNGEFWEQAYQILEQGIGDNGSLLKGSELERLLKSSEGWQGLSKEGKMKWLEELEKMVAQATGYLSLSRQLEDIGTKAGEKITFTNAEGKTLTGIVDKDGNVVVTDKNGNKITYKDVYQDYFGKYHTLESEKDAKTEKKPANSIADGTAGSGSDNDGSGPEKTNNKKYWTLGSDTIWKFPKKAVDGNGEYSTETEAAAAAKSENDKQQKLLEKEIAELENMYGPLTEEQENRLKNKKQLLKYRRIKSYKTGGLVNYTGPAWLDGTPSKPELVLKARDTENFIQLKDHLATLRQISTNGLLGTGGDNYYDIDVHVDSLGSDYDVDMAIDRIKARIYQDGAYRNVNTLNRLR